MVFNRINFSIVFAFATKVIFLGVHEVRKQRKSVDLDWVDGSDQIPIHIMVTRGLGETALVCPSILHVQRVQDVANQQRWSNFVFMIFEFQLSEEILHGFVTDCVNGLVKFFYTEHYANGSVLDFSSFVPRFSFVVNLHLKIHMVAVDCVLTRTFENNVSWNES